MNFDTGIENSIFELENAIVEMRKIQKSKEVSVNKIKEIKQRFLDGKAYFEEAIYKMEDED